MSRFLLITPDQALGQTIIMFLFPEHDVEIGELPDEEKLKTYHLLIVDGSLDGFSEHSRADLLSYVQKSQYPTLWLTDEMGEDPVKRKNLLCVSKPLFREPIRSALDILLVSKLTPNGLEVGNRTVVSKVRGRAVRKNVKKGEQTKEVEPGPIDLVEVVEDSSTGSGENPHDERNS